LVISARRFTDGLLHHSKRLIGEATQPQGAGKEDERAGGAMIKTEEVRVEGAKLDYERHAALTMKLCRGLVAQKVVSIAHQPFRPDGADRVLDSLRDDARLFGDRQRATDVAKPR
jgi:acetyl-CoA carboxylase alpha subunit